MEGINKKLIIFDFDGVFNRYSMEAYQHVIAKTLIRCGAEIDPVVQLRVLDEQWGSPPKDILSSLLQHTPELIQDNPAIVGQGEKTYMEVLESDFAEIIQPVPGSIQMLGRLANKYTLALNTAGDEEILYGKVMPKLGIHSPTDIFKGGILTALSFEDGRLRPKPEPDSTLELMERNSVKPKETVVVGDSDADILTAAYAGVEDIVVPLTGKITLEQAENFQQEFGVEIVPDVTHLERLLGCACLEGCLAAPA